MLKFVKKFTPDKKNELSIRHNSEKTVIITYTKFWANPDNKEMYKNYCLHQIIKFSVWDKMIIKILEILILLLRDG